MAEPELYSSTPKSGKRPNTELEVSPSGTFSLSDISKLMDKKLDPIIQKLDIVDRAINLENRVKELEMENRALKEKLEKQEIYSRKDNVKVIGLRETEGENCEQALLGILQKYCPNFNDRTFIRVHRLGKKAQTGERPIIARFHHYKDKIILQTLMHRIFIENGISIIDDFPPEIEKARRILLPILKAAKSVAPQSGPKPRLVDDKLYIQGVKYTTGDLHKLPKRLRPEAIFTPSNEGKTAFFTKLSPLSNHYPCKFTCKGESYNCTEQYIMTMKATQFNDQATVRRVKAEKDPIRMKQMGKSILGFDKQTWYSVVEEKTTEGVYAKFSQNPELKKFLLETETNLILEASPDRYWGVGKKLKDRDLWDQRRWTGKNVMGNILMNVRDRLKSESTMINNN